MININKTLFGGRLTRDPKLTYTTSGKAVCEFSVAVNTTQDDSKTVFADIVVWERQAELCDRYLRKGSPVLVDGALSFSRWEDKETGKPRSHLSIAASIVHFIDSPVNGDKPKGTQKMSAKTILEMYGKELDEYKEIDGERIYGWRLESKDGEPIPTIEALGEDEFVKLYWRAQSQLPPLKGMGL